VTAACDRLRRLVRLRRGRALSGAGVLGRAGVQRLTSAHVRAVSSEPRERGQISLLILGFTVVALMLIIGGVDVTAVQIARSRLLDAADGAALDASDALDGGQAYGGGLRAAVEISDASVRQAATRYLAVQPRPHGVSSWALSDGTGSPDGQTAVIRLRGTADIPIAASVLSAFGGSVNITVESRARSALR